MRYSGLPAYRLPSVTAATLRSNLRCQNPWGVAAAENRLCCLWEADDVPVAVTDWGGLVLEAALEEWTATARRPDSADGNRPAGEYIGYTYIHLPKLPKNVDAIPASFAARIAFSSF